MRPTIKDNHFDRNHNTENGKDLGQWINELFHPTQRGQEPISRILIQGTAGLGKTVLSKQLSLEWHQSKPGVVIYLLLRNLSNEQRYPAGKTYTLIDVIEKELYGNPFNDLERRLLAYELNRKETVCVVDGLDELHILPQLQDAINELMGKEQLIVTTRPGIQQHPQVQTKIEFQKHLFLQEYSKKEIHQFIDTYFSDSDTFLELKERIKKAIETNKQLNKLCSIPVTLSVICQLVKQGNEEVLIKQNTAELYGCCIVAHLREACKRQENVSTHVPDYQIRDRYRTALRFMELLAYESLKKYRSVSASKEIMEGVLTLQNIDQPLDRKSLFEELKAIGLVEVTPFGAEFVHATFQEYFAACFLIKSFTKSKKKEAFQKAKAFIEGHKFNFNYQSLFSFMLQQLLFLISQEKEEATKKKFMRLLANSVSSFTQPIDQNDIYRQGSAFLMGISMLNAYAKGIESRAFTEEDFIKEHGNFIETAFQHMLCEEFTSFRHLNTGSNTLIPSLRPEEIDCQFATLFLTIPSLKEQYKVYSRLFKNIQVKNPEVLSMTWRTIFFIQSIQEFNEQTIHDVHKIAFEIQDKMAADLFRGVLELTLNRIEEIVLQQTLSADDVAKLQSLRTALEEQLKALFSIVTRKPFELTMVEKIIRCLEILLKQKDRSPAINEIVTTITTYLPDYVSILFSSSNQKIVAKHCQHLISLQSLGLSLSSIFNIKTIEPLKKRMDGYLEKVSRRDGRTGRGKSLWKVGYMLEHFLPIVDFACPTYGRTWLEVLYELYCSGGRCTSKPAKENCRTEVSNALSHYQPYIFIPSKIDNSVIYFERFHFVCWNFFYNSFRILCDYYSVEQRKKLLEWLKPLMEHVKLSQYKKWISGVCENLEDSISEYEIIK